MRSTWLAERAVLALIAVAAGAWLAVMDAATEPGFGTHRTGWGPLPFVIAAAIGLAWSSRLQRPLSGRVGLVVLMAAVGAVAAAASAGLPVASGAGPGSDLSSTWLIGLLGEPIGWFAVIGVAWGAQYQVQGDDGETNLRLLAVALPLLVLPWLAGYLQPPAERSTFIDIALPATSLFATAGLLGLGLARLQALRRGRGIEGRGTRSVAMLLVFVVFAVAIAAIPAAFLLGDPVTLLALAILGPIHALLSPLADLLYQLLLWLFTALPIGGSGSTRPGGGPAGGEPLNPVSHAPQSPFAFSGNSPVGIILVGTISGALIVLAIAWLGRRRRPRQIAAATTIVEERRVRIPTPVFRRPSLPKLSFRERAPETASEAYLAALRRLEPRPGLARRDTEGPAAHVGRLRAAGTEPGGLSPLAADYQLEQYGNRHLTAAETARAMSRLRRVRGFLRESPRHGDVE